MDNVLTVPDLTTLQAIKNLKEGEVAYCEDTQKFMVYTNGEWVTVEQDLENNGLRMSLYELNKQVICQLPPFDEVRINDAIEQINNWCNGNFIMLYGREMNYFTVFRYEEKNPEFTSLGTGVIELLKEISTKIYAIDVVNESTVEIWIDHDEAPTMLLLFNYDAGIVAYGK